MYLISCSHSLCVLSLLLLLLLSATSFQQQQRIFSSMNVCKRFERFKIKNLHVFDRSTRSQSNTTTSTNNNNIISSSNNDKVKLIKSLDTTKARIKHNMIRLEGHRQVIDALRSRCFTPTFVMFTKRALDAKDQTSSAILKQELDTVLTDCDPNRVIEVSEGVMNDICDTVTNQGIVAAFVKPEPIKELQLHANTNGNIILVLDGLSDPGNMGSLIRSAVSFGVSHIVSIGGCDIWSPKVIRYNYLISLF